MHTTSDSNSRSTKLDKALQQIADDPIEAPEYLATRILANLPEQPKPWTDALLIWFQQGFWRVAVVAALPLVVGFGVGSAGVQDTEQWREAEMLVFQDGLEEYTQ